LYIEALTKSLSIFNKLEANAFSLDKAGYQFELKLVSKDSDEIHKTVLGKIPLIRDVF
jgi:hypothetical protein